MTELQFSIDLEIGLKVDNCSYKSAWDCTLVTSDLFEHVPIAQNTDQFWKVSIIHQNVLSIFVGTFPIRLRLVWRNVRIVHSPLTSQYIIYFISFLIILRQIKAPLKFALLTKCGSAAQWLEALVRILLKAELLKAFFCNCLNCSLSVSIIC